jgi:hypothetical protein
MKRLSLTTAAGALLAGIIVSPTPVFSAPDVMTYEIGSSGDVRPTGRPPGTALTPQAAIGGNVTYHGGPVILGTTNMYYIWYGNWTGNTAVQILTDFANNIGGSPYYNINTVYGDASRNRVSNSVHFGGSANDNYSLGSSLSDRDIQTIVSNAITSGALPKDTNGVYFVLTSADVSETSGFCNSYCAWHTFGIIGGSNIKYSFCGNTERCLDTCASLNKTKSPNDNPGADNMIDSIAHELEEAVVDPNLNAWYDRIGRETADKCAYKYGTTYTVSNGSLANMRLGTRDYLIQQNWNRLNGGFCTLSFP